MANKSKTAARAERAERAAALLREQRSRERKRNLITAGVVAVVLAALVVGAVLLTRGGGVDAEDVTAGSSEYGVTVGEADAPHTLVIYEDFLCPACGQFEASTNERLTELAADGRVLVDYRPFELLSQAGDYSARSVQAFGVVLEESGPEVAKEFHDVLFANQPGEGDAEFPDADQLVGWAVEAGAEEDAVRAGIEAGTGDFSDGATAEAQANNVTGTPTVILDGEPFDGSYDELYEALEN